MEEINNLKDYDEIEIINFFIYFLKQTFEEES